uniref:hypothetical protein n=1 Tax=Atlantibacter hermannii TaxID=565 RepID=UPI00289A6048
NHTLANDVHRAVVLINHLILCPYRQAGGTFVNLLRVNDSTSSRYSYTPGRYFVGVLPWWSLLRFDELILSLRLNYCQAFS